VVDKIFLIHIGQRPLCISVKNLLVQQHECLEHPTAGNGKGYTLQSNLTKKKNEIKGNSLFLCNKLYVIVALSGQCEVIRGDKRKKRGFSTTKFTNILLESGCAHYELKARRAGVCKVNIKGELTL